MYIACVVLGYWYTEILSDYFSYPEGYTWRNGIPSKNHMLWTEQVIFFHPPTILHPIR